MCEGDDLERAGDNLYKEMNTLGITLDLNLLSQIAVLVCF